LQGEDEQEGEQNLDPGKGGAEALHERTELIVDVGLVPVFVLSHLLRPFRSRWVYIDVPWV
jgi:hypothetical protein